MKIASKTLILGGVKSGKSRYAESLAKEAGNPVTLIATATARDEEMAARIARHRADRPSQWTTVEEPLYLGQAIREAGTPGTILVDCLTLWLTNLLMKDDAVLLDAELSEFEQAVAGCAANLILVSNETNMGVVPLGELSRRYCDEVGLLHQRLAVLCDRVTLVVAGLPLNLK